MNKYSVIVLLWAFSLPLMAQDTQPNNMPDQEFEQIIQEFFDLSNRMMGQMSDSTMTRLAPKSFFKFYHFPQGDGSMQELMPEEWQELMKQGFGSLDSIQGQNPLELLDMEQFMQMMPDSLQSGENPFEQFFGEGFKFPEGIENSDKKKKRKVYSL